MTDIYDIIKGLPPMSVDEQVNTYHCKEGKGNDRLYIKRTANGYLFNCFHCGKSGGVRASALEGEGVRVKAERGKHDSRHSYTSLPRDGEGDVGRWPPQARGWVGKYISRDEVDEYNLLYSPRLRRIVLPVFSGGSLVGYQTRKVYDDDGGPKYATYARDSSLFYLHTHPRGVDATPVCVVVEDMLSAIKCRRFVSSAALFGVSLKDTLLGGLVRHHSKFLIFLDDDNLQVRAAARKLKKRLDIFGECGIIEGVGKDPKACTDDELRRLLT